MNSIKNMVKDALADAITSQDIEEAVGQIVEGIDIPELLSENEALKDAVYSHVDELITSVIEMYL